MTICTILQEVFDNNDKMYLYLGVESNHLKIIRHWPDTQILADDVQEQRNNVRQWVKRGKIPAKFWPRIVKAAVTRGYPVTFDDLDPTV